MSALCNGFVDAMLRHYFQNAAQTNIGNAAGLLPSTEPGSLYFALHATDPGDTGNQTTGEINYTGYTRAAVTRSSSGFTVSNKSVGPAAELSFGQRTDTGTVTAYFFSVGTAPTGAGTLILRGAIGNAPRLFTSASGTVTSPGHGLAVNDQLTIAAFEGLSLPTGVAEGQVLWVRSVTGDSFTLATTQGGTTIALGSGQGSFQRLTPLTVTQNTTPKLETQTLIKFQ